ncbi:MAG: hypothetical protein K9H26_01295 [Prolixibacteraceae bacterium]|nr:hypothetical protein [Prolixibacteraceae bacterium]
MKPIVIFTCIIFLLITACEKDTPPFADEDITISSSMPGFAVYKTKGDYFNYIAVYLDSNENIAICPVYNENSIHIIKDKDNKIQYTERWKLKSGYIVDREMIFINSFTDVTFQEQIEYIKDNSDNFNADLYYKPRIIDKNPFVEYYHISEGLGRDFTLGEINQMAENGTLETYFTKLK